MSSRQGDIPALESGACSSLFGAMSSPVSMVRHTVSYDELIDAPMHSPPPDMAVNILWKDPIKPKHRFWNATEEGESGGRLVTFEAAAPAKSPVPVVKAKATTLMSALMKQSHENMQRFEHQAGLTDTGYSPHKGLSAEETRFHLRAESTFPKLKMPPGDFKEDRLQTSAQSTPAGTPSVTPSVTPCVTPSVTPHSSPALSRRNWFTVNPGPLLPASELSSASITDMGNEGRGTDRWNFFGSRSTVQKSPTDPGSDTGTGFSLQSYFGLQKSSTMDYSSTQVKLDVGDTANFMPPKIEISGIEPKQPPRPHKLKPRDMNVLTPSGF
ncbi:putative monooxygenase p33MONOX [Eucyclogobius newberryi]|uniref:putative monooxygenase p33MONOX n=1 Tax=Eucyclogobius newberryi TaxID=166745 RepID=UPI003B5974EA